MVVENTLNEASLFDRNALERAIDLQSKSYLLLRWMAEAIEKGFIRFRTAHKYASLPEAASDWIKLHHNDIPLNARPDLADLDDFSRLFATYIENSFELLEQPDKRMGGWIPIPGCSCQDCSRFFKAPHLKVKSVNMADKKRASRMMRAVAGRLAIMRRIDATDAELDKLVQNRDMREHLSIVTWADDLQNRLSGAVRLDGAAIGAAQLVLWRGFAWTKAGAPRKDFRPSAEMVLKSEKLMITPIASKSRASVVRDASLDQ